MPGASPRGVDGLPVRDELEASLRGHVGVLAERIGPRSPTHATALASAAAYVEGELARAGYTPQGRCFGPSGTCLRNVAVDAIGGDPTRIVVVGAHFDTIDESPGADDNASGVAVLLELARLRRTKAARATVRFIAFTTEEAPWGRTPHRGSRVAAAASRAAGEAIEAMLSIESVGFYATEGAGQRHPWPLGWILPETPDFVAFVANPRSRPLLRTAIAAFRAGCRLPSDGMVALESLFADARRSDHASYWDAGYPALLVTDTAPFRNPHYHRPTDRPETLHYRALAELTVGLDAVVDALVR